ncbi:MAG: hypothetical protein ACRCX7_10000 [Cetobacterium sp.]|uniref:hypothetical protein n=1 Tax=Cetobacterium sp. TaxID=2071632 RepID=UPI003F37AB67
MNFKELEIQIENKYKTPNIQDDGQKGYAEWFAKFKEDEVESVKDLFRDDFRRCVDVIRNSKPSHNGSKYYGNLYILKYFSTDRIMIKVTGENHWNHRQCYLDSNLYSESGDRDLAEDNIRGSDEDELKDKLIRKLLIPFINQHLEAKFDKMCIPKSIRYYYTMEDVDGRAANPNRNVDEGGFVVTDTRPDMFIKVMIVIMGILFVSALFGGAVLHG